MSKKSERERNHDAIRKAQKAILSAKPKAKERPNVHRRSTAGLWARPFASEALGVNPDQIPEATKALRAAGVTADFDKEGRLVVSSDKQFREAAKACGLWNGRDGYGGGMTAEGTRVVTGREREREKQRFREAVERGDYD